MTPDEARAALAGAERSRSHLAGSLRLPPYFHALLGAGIAVHVTLTAWALTSVQVSSGRIDGLSFGMIGLGLAVFLVAAAVDIVGFRRLNGASVAGLFSRVVFGTGWLSSTVYTAGMGFAIWAGFAGLRWALVVIGVATGLAYAAAGSRWWSAYRADPEGHAHAESRQQLAALVLVAMVGLVLLAVAAR